MDVTAFYGRESELAELEQWVLDDRCRLVVLLGIGGIGKTTLSIKFAQQVAPHFAFVFWRSLRNAPPLEEMLADCIQTLSEQQYTSLPQNVESSITLLLELLQKRRCLLVLDNVETLLQARSFEGRIWSVICSPDGKTFASGGDDLSIKLWKVGSGRCLKTFLGHTVMICSMAFSPDGDLLASSSFDRTVKLWQVDREEGEACLQTLFGHTTFVWSVAFSPDGSLLASGDNDGAIRLWEVENGQCLKTLHTGTSPIGALVFSTDGRTLISSSSDEGVTLWGVSSGNCLKSWRGRGLAGFIRAMAFSRDGTMLAIGNNDHTVKLWQHEETRSIDTFRTFLRQEGQVWSMAFSPKDHLLASGYDDGTLIVLDVQTGAPYQVLRSDRPYERMNIRGVKGLTEAQKGSLKALGAIEAEGEPSF